MKNNNKETIVKIWIAVKVSVAVNISDGKKSSICI